MNWDSLRKALNNDGKISEDEREELITRGIPDCLLGALADGQIDDQERADLMAMGFPTEVVDLFADGNLSEEEVDQLRTELAKTMRKWREKQLQAMFTKFDHILK